jgi:hypothetical protein
VTILRSEPIITHQHFLLHIMPDSVYNCEPEEKPVYDYRV